MPRRKPETPRQKKISTLIDELQRPDLTNAEIEILRQNPANTKIGSESGATGDLLEVSGFTYLMPAQRHSNGRREPQFQKVYDGQRTVWIPADADALKLCERNLPQDLCIKKSNNPAAGFGLFLKKGRQLCFGTLIGPMQGVFVPNVDEVGDKSYLTKNPNGQVSFFLLLHFNMNDIFVKRSTDI